MKLTNYMLTVKFNDLTLFVILYPKRRPNNIYGAWDSIYSLPKATY